MPSECAADRKSGWLRAYEKASSDRLWDEQPHPFLKNYMDRLRHAGAGGVLDIGCGEGRNLTLIAKAGLPTVGMDLSPLALEKANQAAARNGVQHIALVCGDIDALPHPFINESISVVTCLDVFGHLADPALAASKIYSLLRPGGMLLTNLYSTNDEIFGAGTRIAEKQYEYRGTLFRFFDRSDAESVFEKFQLLAADIHTWLDPPHPGFREQEHTHESIVLLLRKP